MDGFQVFLQLSEYGIAQYVKMCGPDLYLIEIPS
jgi:hypothetical protein